MEDFLNPSPIGLNKPDSTSSPFIDSSFELGVGLNFDNNIFTQKPDKTAENNKEEASSIKNCEKRKRINDFDGNILSKYSQGEESEKLTFGQKLSTAFKNKKAIFNFENIKNLRFEDAEDLFYLFFPGVYKSKAIRSSIERLIALNKIANDLVTKKIPYGEQQEHYSDLIESLSLATNIQADLKKKIS